jgi:hypothetical protein
MRLCHTGCRHARAHAWINRPTKSTGKSSGQVPDVNASSIILVFLRIHDFVPSLLRSEDPKFIVISPFRTDAPLISGEITCLTRNLFENEDAQPSCHPPLCIVQRYHGPKQTAGNQVPTNQATAREYLNGRGE